MGTFKHPGQRILRSDSPLRKDLTVAKPDIFNTNQGCQFTSEAFIGELDKANVRISMDEKGRCMDNIFIERLWISLKYKDIYMKDYSSVQSLREGLMHILHFITTSVSTSLVDTEHLQKSIT